MTWRHDNAAVEAGQYRRSEPLTPSPLTLSNFLSSKFFVNREPASAPVTESATTANKTAARMPSVISNAASSPGAPWRFAQHSAHRALLQWLSVHL